MTWDTFTTVFLWRFKPEYRVVLPLLEEIDEEDKGLTDRDILPLLDDKEEPVQESSPSTAHDDGMVAVSTLIDVNLRQSALSDVKKEEENPNKDGFGGRSAERSLPVNPVSWSEPSPQ